jgi:hypothetical protein
MTSEGSGMEDRPRALLRAGVSVATLFAGSAIGGLAVLLWGELQPKRILEISTMDPGAMVIEPFVIPPLVWVVGIGGGLFHAAAILKYLRRI